MVRFPCIIWSYIALTVVFVGSGLARYPYPESPGAPEITFHRNPLQTFGDLVADGLWQPDYAKIRTSMNLLSPLRLGRELGNSLRLAGGQHIEWIIWGGRKPLMLFMAVETWVSRGLDAKVQADLNRIADIIASERDRLDSEGWKLLMVPVPTKLGIYREYCTWPVWEPSLLNRAPLDMDHSDEVYGYFYKKLQENGVPAIDLQTIYRHALVQRPGLLLYPPSESHWSGEGIRLAAQNTARAIASISPLHDRIPHMPTYLEVDHIGDLAKAYDPFPELLFKLNKVWHFHDKLINGELGRGYRYPANPIGLVVAVGTSYTGQYTWYKNQPVGFAWQLGLHLDNVEVQNRPMAGHGSLESYKVFSNLRHEIAKDFDDKHGKGLPKVIVWEFPIRDINNILELASKN